MRARFVCARITKMNDQDIARFDFDFDTTWNAFFLDADLNVYSRYGGRDHREPEERMGKESLLQTMREVLEAHEQRNQATPGDLARLFQPVKERSQTPDDIPLLKQGHRGCLHCHQIREYRLLQWGHDGSFDRRRLFRWPLPENVGIQIERTHGHKVASVENKSAAADAGVKAGDVLKRINDVPVRSEYDIRWAFDQAPDGEPLRLVIQRLDETGNPQQVPLDLEPGTNWRATDIGWRKSLRSLPIDWGLRAYALSPGQREKEGFRPDELAIRVTWVRDHGLGKILELNKKDVIVALDGHSANRQFNEFQSDLLARYQPGDEIRITVVRDGKQLELTGEFPAWHTTEDTVP